MGAVEGWEDPEADEADKQRAASAAAAARESARVQATCRAATLAAAEAGDTRDSEALGTDTLFDTRQDLKLYLPPEDMVPDVFDAANTAVTEAPGIGQVLPPQPGSF